jgi:hypothetical protein
VRPGRNLAGSRSAAGFGRGCLAEGTERFELWVGAAVLANNLMVIASLLTKRSQTASVRRWRGARSNSGPCQHDRHFPGLRSDASLTSIISFLSDLG